MESLNDYLLYHRDRKVSQSKRFQEVVDTIGKEKPTNANIIVQNLYNMLCEKKICIYNAKYTSINGKSYNMLMLTLSVICKTQNEMFAIPLNIRLDPKDISMLNCPEVFLLYNPSLTINKSFEYFDINNNSIKTPYMQNWTNTRHEGFEGLITHFITLFSDYTPLLCTIEGHTCLISPDKYQRSHDEIGRGSFGVVYEGLYNESPVAIKECKLIPDNQSVLLELEVLTRLKHQCIITNYGYNTRMDGNDIILNFIMEKADCNLENYLGNLVIEGRPSEIKKTIPYKHKRLYVHQIATGLCYTWQEGIVHGDLKMDNVLIVNGNCKIADFGLSKIIKDETDLSVSRVGILGNLMHRAPELYSIEYREKEESNELKNKLLKADVYAFGILVGEILTGYKVTNTYKGDIERKTNAFNWAIDMQDGFRFRPNSYLKQDPVIYQIVSDCMKELDERPSMNEICDRVKEWYAGDVIEIHVR